MRESHRCFCSAFVGPEVPSTVVTSSFCAGPLCLVECPSEVLVAMYRPVADRETNNSLQNASDDGNSNSRV